MDHRQRVGAAAACAPRRVHSADRSNQRSHRTKMKTTTKLKLKMKHLRPAAVAARASTDALSSAPFARSAPQRLPISRRAVAFLVAARTPTHRRWSSQARLLPRAWHRWRSTSCSIWLKMSRLPRRPFQHRLRPARQMSSRRLRRVQQAPALATLNATECCCTAESNSEHGDE